MKHALAIISILLAVLALSACGGSGFSDRQCVQVYRQSWASALDYMNGFSPSVIRARIKQIADANYAVAASNAHLRCRAMPVPRDLLNQIP